MNPSTLINASLCVGLVVVGALAGCRAEPAVRFVHSETFKEDLNLLASKRRIRVGEPLTLYAQRRSGPWKSVPSDSVGPDQCSLRAPPTELEAEVAGSLAWSVDPPGSAEFDPNFDEKGPRQVSFSEPGVYVLTATSASECGGRFSGNEVRVEVVE